MQGNGGPVGGLRALLLDADAFVRERASAMLGAEGYAVCGVDDVGLFRELHSSVAFDLYVIGVESTEQVRGIAEEAQDLRPLLLLAPLGRGVDPGHLKLAFPEARRVDRQLRRSTALRDALEPLERESAPLPPAGDPVRRTFGPFGLSERQLEVLSLALLGESTRDIARQLYISERTVRNHLHAIYGQVGVSGQRELLGRFVRSLVEVGV